MAVTEYDGIVINKVTLSQYKNLKATNQIVASQTYVITDLDERLAELELPDRLHENSNDNRMNNADIDGMKTGFGFWDCARTNLRPLNYEEYYLVFSNTYLTNGEIDLGVQIAIGAGSNYVFVRNRYDATGWKSWQRIAFL